MNNTLLKVNDLRLCIESFYTEEESVVLNGVSFDLDRDKITAVIGECGSGKSMMGMAIYRLLPEGATSTGEIFFEGKDLLNLPDRQMDLIRGNEMVLVSQMPAICLLRDKTIGNQLSDALKRYGTHEKQLIREQSLDALTKVGLTDTKEFINKYPREIKGTTLQRISLALGLAAGRPKLLILDEPTRGLEGSERYGYMDMIGSVFSGSAVLLMTHDLDIANISDDVIVLYAGEIVEAGPREKVLKYPLHPYTIGILAAFPKFGMMSIPGPMVYQEEEIMGCRFHPRCSLAKDICRSEHPQLKDAGGVKVRCFFINNT